MRKFISLLLISVLVSIPFSEKLFAYLSIKERVVIEDVTGVRTIVISRYESRSKWSKGSLKRYHIHVKRGCRDQIVSGRTVYLVLEGEPDGHNDFIQSSQYYKCAIDEIEPVTQKLYVKNVFNDKTSAVLTDENGKDYFVTYSSICRNLFAYRKRHVYADMGGQELKQGDRLILPERTGICSLDYVEKKEPSEENLQEKAEAAKEEAIKKALKEADLPPEDKKLPTAPRRARAIPKNGSAFVYWQKSKDNVAISHYIVGYSLHPLDTRDYTPEQMSYTVTTEKTRLTILGLESGTTYYFYIMAVDTSGNRSSLWSNEATATPKSSIRRYDRREWEKGSRD